MEEKEDFFFLPHNEESREMRLGCEKRNKKRVEMRAGGRTLEIKRGLLRQTRTRDLMPSFTVLWIIQDSVF